MLAGLAVAGCGAKVKQSPCSPRVQLIVPPPTVLTLNRREVTIPMQLPLAFSCPGGNPRATSVETEVLDPQNVAVDHAASTPESSNTLGYSTAVTFTPQAPGGYYLTASFEPSLGVQHRSVAVAEDHGADQPLVDGVVVPAGCVPTHLTASLLICRNSTTTVIRPATGQTFSLVGVVSIRAAPPSYWAWTDTTLTRYEDTGTGSLEKRESLRSTDPLPSRWANVAFEKTLLVFDQGAVTTYAANGTDLVVESRVDVPGLDPVGQGYAVALTDSTYGVLTTNKSVCHVRLGPTPSATCVTTQGQPLGIDGPGFWVMLPPDDSTAYLHFIGDLPTLSKVQNDATGRQLGSGLPYFNFDSMFLTVRHDDLVLDAYPKLSGAIAVGVLPTAFWQIDGAGRLRAYRK